jgi:hypothetical protein
MARIPHQQQRQQPQNRFIAALQAVGQNIAQAVSPQRAPNMPTPVPSLLPPARQTPVALAAQRALERRIPAQLPHSPLPRQQTPIPHSPLTPERRQELARQEREFLAAAPAATQIAPRLQIAPQPAQPVPLPQLPLTPQQRQQEIENIAGRIADIRRQIDAITQARAAGMPITPQTTAQQAQEFLAAIPAAPAAAPVPPTPTEQMRQLLTEEMAALRSPAVIEGLTPEERQTFADERRLLADRYTARMDALRRQHEREQQRLIGRYAVAGFTEPGIIAGPMAGEPGIVTRALGDIREQQRRELAELEQAKAGGLLDVARAERELERRGRAEEIGRFERRRAAMQRILERQMELAEPERFTLGGRIFQRDPVTGQVTDVTPPEALQQQVEVERGGRRLRITFDAQGREVGHIDLGPVERARIDKPASFEEWILAGGLEGTGMTYMQWLDWRRARGGREEDDLLTPPPRP